MKGWIASWYAEGKIIDGRSYEKWASATAAAQTTQKRKRWVCERATVCVCILMFHVHSVYHTFRSSMCANELHPAVGLDVMKNTLFLSSVRQPPPLRLFVLYIIWFIINIKI